MYLAYLNSDQNQFDNLNTQVPGESVKKKIFLDCSHEMLSEFVLQLFSFVSLEL